MRVSDFLKKECCIMNLEADNKQEAMKEIVSCLHDAGKISDLDKFAEDVLERESLGSTGIGYGIAIPHARTESVSGFAIGFGRASKGVDFNSIDGEKVSLIFLMGSDPAELNRYLRLLAELSKLLMNSSFRQALMDAQSPEEIIQIIRKFES